MLRRCKWTLSVGGFPKVGALILYSVRDQEANQTGHLIINYNLMQDPR